MRKACTQLLPEPLLKRLNPATEQVIARVAEADAADVDAAVRSVESGIRRRPGVRCAAADRGQALLRFADRIRQNAD